MDNQSISKEIHKLFSSEKLDILRKYSFDDFDSFLVYNLKHNEPRYVHRLMLIFIDYIKNKTYKEWLLIFEQLKDDPVGFNYLIIFMYKFVCIDFRPIYKDSSIPQSTLKYLNLEKHLTFLYKNDDDLKTEKLCDVNILESMKQSLIIDGGNLAKTIGCITERDIDGYLCDSYYYV